MPFHPFMLIEPPPPPISYIWSMKVSTYSHSYCPRRVILCVVWKNDIGLLGFFVWFTLTSSYEQNRSNFNYFTLLFAFNGLREEKD